MTESFTEFDVDEFENQLSTFETLYRLKMWSNSRDYDKVSNKSHLKQVF